MLDSETYPAFRLFIGTGTSDGTGTNSSSIFFFIGTGTRAGPPKTVMLENQLTCSCRKLSEVLTAHWKLAPTGAEDPYLLMAARTSDPSVASPSVLVTLMAPSVMLQQ